MLFCLTWMRSCWWRVRRCPASWQVLVLLELPDLLRQRQTRQKGTKLISLFKEQTFSWYIAKRAQGKNVTCSKNYPVLLTQSSESCWSNQLHQLVVAHVSQQVLQASLSSECGEFVATAASAACRSGNGRVVQVLVHLTTVLLIFVSLWLLMEIERARVLLNQSWILHRPNYLLFLSGDTRQIIHIT